eukprot:PhF_6_TR9241/c0_g1_i1/m.14610/K14721/RPC5, POLR3E; DNA-directed RNA polymerase III subunit RPC5
MSTTEDDPIVAEYDVYMNPDMGPSLHALQFPLRPNARPYELHNVSEVRVGAQSNRITLVMEEVVEGSEYFPHDRIANDVHTYTLKGGAVIRPNKETASVGQYVAIFSGTSMHLTPVASVQQLRPVLTGLHGALTEANLDDDDIPTAPRLPQSGHLSKMRSVYMYDEKHEEQNVMSFVPTDNRPNSDSSEVRSLLFCPTTDTWRYDGSKQNVLQTACPILPSAEYKPPPSLLGSYPIERQVYGLMVSAQVLPLWELVGTVVPPHGAPWDQSVLTTVLKALDNSAVLIRGVWVCRMGKGFNAKGALLREYVLLQLWESESGSIRRDELHSKFPQSLHKTLNEILKTVSVLEPSKRRWELNHLKATPPHWLSSSIVELSKIPEDILHNQSLQWAQRKPEIMENTRQLIAAVNTPALATARLPKPTMYWAPPPPEGMIGEGGATRSAGSQQSSAQSVGEDVQRDVLGVLRQLYASHGVILGANLLPLLRRDKTKADSKIKNVEEPVCLAVIKKSVVRIQGNATILKSWDDPVIEEYRPTFIKFFQTNISATRAEIRDFIMKHLNKDIPDATFKRIVMELAEFKANENKWVLKSGVV